MFKSTLASLLLLSATLLAQTPTYDAAKTTVNRKLQRQADGKNISGSIAEAILTVNDRITTVRNTAELQAYSGPATQLTTSDGRSWTYNATSVLAANVGTVVLASGKGKGRWLHRAKDVVNILDFGATPNDATDDQAAIQRAVDYTATNDVTIIVPDGIYKVNSPIVKAESFSGLNLRAAGSDAIFDYSEIKKSLPCLKIVGGSGKLCQATVNGIRFRGNTSSIGIDIVGQCGQTITHCTFETNLIGIRFHNDAPNSFSEWNTGAYCSFEASCQYAIAYKKTKGNNSFHGSGLTGINYINASGAAVVLVGEDCFPYNAPLNAQVWFKQNCAFIQNDNENTTTTPYFNGNVTFEHFGGAITLATKNKVYFTGGIQAMGDFVASGLFYQCDALVINKNNSSTPYGLRWNGQLTVNSASTTVGEVRGAIYQVAVTVVGANYDYRYILIVDSSGGTSGKGSVTTLATTREFNSSGYGKGTFSIDGSGRLVLTNPNYPTSGSNQLKIYATFRQIADHYYGNYPARSF
ncbi:glycosyl hydrolase family 28-related protein [Spirosoma arcticum]